MKEINVPWSAVRGGIHLAYDYYKDEPQQFDYLANMNIKDLQELETYCRLQINYNSPCREEELSWDDILRLVLIELCYKQSQTY